jgi:hypothetical protein
MHDHTLTTERIIQLTCCRHTFHDVAQHRGDALHYTAGKHVLVGCEFVVFGVAASGNNYNNQVTESSSSHTSILVLSQTSESVLPQSMWIVQ